MYLIVVYDINEKRVNKVCKFLRTYLYWIQNSVFEGEVTNANFEKMMVKLKKIIDEKEDSVIFFKMPSEKGMEKEILGVERNEITNIL
ncbi:MAG: CRISPR-associated endonuclease Cas2 [Candidatus Altarchaeum sp. CG2_30_32_3053]|nr:MAG: CRISPR-associated endonuclease Cas2 [Candidatus Altarchaeum sp. CG2_30_32_3053]